MLCGAPSVLAAQAAVTVTGTVSDSLGAPIADAHIAADGTGIRATTDAKGRFQIANLKPGPLTLTVRRLGFERLTIPLELSADDEVSLAIELHEFSTELAPVIVRKDAVSARLAATGFENRRRFSGAPPGQFITRAQLDAVRPLNVSQMIGRMSERAMNCRDGLVFVDGVLLARQVADQSPQPSASTLALMQSSNAATANAASRRAAMDIAQNGTPMPKPLTIDQISINQIEGIEVYASAAQIPNEYRAAFRSARCAILLWTR